MIALWDVPLIPRTGPGRGDAAGGGSGRRDRGHLRPGERSVGAGDRAARAAAPGRGPGDRAAGQPGRGRAVREAGVAVLDVAGLSAPSVVEVCLGEWRPGAVAPLGMRFLAARTTAPQAADAARTLRCARPRRGSAADGGDASICPGRDHPGGRGRRGDAVRDPGRAARGRGGDRRAGSATPADARPGSPVGGPGRWRCRCCPPSRTAGWRPPWPPCWWC